MGIIAGVLGGLSGILLGLLAYFWWLLRKQRNGGVGDPQTNPVGGYTHDGSELGRQKPELVGTYPMTELP